MKVGVIGLGSIGSRHAKNLKAIGHEVIGFDPDKGRRSGFKYRELIENVIEDSEAIVIASPTNEHFIHIAQAINYKKPVFVEKPITDANCSTLLGYAKDNNIIIMVGYNLRMHPCVIKAKEWMDNGVIGKPLWANFTCGQFTEKVPYLRDGVTLNWSHEIDLALYLLGPANVAASSIPKIDLGATMARFSESLVDIILTHERCQSTVHLDYLTKPEIRQSIIVGTKASIIMDLVNRNAWLRGAEGVMWDHIVDEEGSWDDDYVAEMKAFIDRVEGKETLGATGEDGLRVLEICLEVRKQAGLK